MQILNTFKFKIGSGGKRNRANLAVGVLPNMIPQYVRRRLHAALDQALDHATGEPLLVVEAADRGSNKLVIHIPTNVDEAAFATRMDVAWPLVGPNPAPGIITMLDLTGKWDETLARKALALFEKSGKSGRAFSAEHGISYSKLRSWAKKLYETSAA